MKITVWPVGMEILMLDFSREFFWKARIGS